MKIAIVGTGISGMTAAYLLHEDHDITLFEAKDYIGGHAHTVDAEVGGSAYPVDTGFMVFNRQTYPGLITILDRLGIQHQSTSMSFSMSCKRTGMEYSPSSLNSLFAQRRNLFNPSLYRIIYDVFRFRRESAAILNKEDYETSLMDYLEQAGYSRAFIDYFIIPMGAAIWSADPTDFGNISARIFSQFLANHGILNVRDQPEWLTITGGSRKYVEALTAPFADRIRLSTPVSSIRRHPDFVEVVDNSNHIEQYDHVILAVHSDQAIKIVDDIQENEREILEALPYSRNRTVLHTDEAVLPKSKRAWACWNYLVPQQKDSRVVVTYNMNKLQSLTPPGTLCVTLNGMDYLDGSKILFDTEYSHPLFSIASVSAQKRWKEISGENRTSYCGAYWRNGFHEDGLQSALWVCKQFGKELS